MEKRHLNVLVIVLSILLIVCTTIQTTCAEQRRWFVQFDNHIKNPQSKAVLKGVTQQVHKRIYCLILGEKETTIVDITDDSGRHCQYRHQFFLYQDDSQFNVGDGKVYVRFNPPNQDEEPNINLWLFIRKKDNTWERVLNPGNFRFAKAMPFVDLQRRIRNIIVGLTFK